MELLIDLKDQLLFVLFFEKISEIKLNSNKGIYVYIDKTGKIKNGSANKFP